MKIKKIVIVTIFLVALVPYFAQAQNTNSQAIADSKLSLDSHDIYNNESYGDANPPYLNRMDPAWVPILQPVWHEKTKKGRVDITLPEMYRDQGWEIWKGTPDNKYGIPLWKFVNSKSKQKAKPFFHAREAIDTTSEDLEDIVIPLEYWPWGANDIAWTKAFLRKDENLPEKIKLEAINDLWQKKRMRFCVILYNSKHISEGSARGVGGGGAVSSGIGSIKNTIKRALTAALSLSGGKSKSTIWEEPTFMVVAFDIYVSKEDAIKNMKGISLISAKILAETEAVEISKLQRTKFPHNSAEIMASEIYKMEDYADYIFKVKLKNNEYIAAETGASEEGDSLTVNAPLSEKRARNIYDATVFILNSPNWPYQMSLEEIQKKFRFHYKGENFPAHVEHQKPGPATESPNREGYLVKVTEITPKNMEAQND